MTVTFNIAVCSYSFTSVAGRPNLADPDRVGGGRHCTSAHRRRRQCRGGGWGSGVKPLASRWQQVLEASRREKVRLRAPPLPSLLHFACRGPRRAAAAPWPLFAARPTVPFFCRSVSKQSGEVAAAGAASRGMNWDWFRYRRQPAR